jgi:NAD(P)-dependent dehydrogenase (short-subunit alcohol dehydrogenase family)
VAREIGARGRKALPVATDLNTTAGVTELFDAVVNHFGGCDILVNTLGSDEVPYMTLDVMPDDVWQQHLDIGLLAAVRCCRAAIPLMRQRGGGSIVNLSAMSIRKQFPSMVAYTAAKAALASVSKNLARTLGADDITVNTVCPGAILTEGVREKIAALGAEHWVTDAGRLDPHDETIESVFLTIAREMGGPGHGLVPDLGRPGRPDEIAAAVVFLCSARSRYTTGVMLNVDGGSDF